jgi:hypothetical protein
MIAAGVNAKALSSYMGHSTITMTRPAWLAKALLRFASPCSTLTSLP